MIIKAIHVHSVAQRYISTKDKNYRHLNLTRKNNLFIFWYISFQSFSILVFPPKIGVVLIILILFLLFFTSPTVSNSRSHWLYTPSISQICPPPSPTTLTRVTIFCWNNSFTTGILAFIVYSLFICYYRKLCCYFFKVSSDFLTHLDSNTTAFSTIAMPYMILPR